MFKKIGGVFSTEKKHNNGNVSIKNIAQKEDQTIDSFVTELNKEH